MSIESSKIASFHFISDKVLCQRNNARHHKISRHAIKAYSSDAVPFLSFFFFAM